MRRSATNHAISLLWMVVIIAVFAALLHELSHQRKLNQRLRAANGTLERIATREFERHTDDGE